MSCRFRFLFSALVISLGALAGCASPSDRLCEENLRCSGDEDPAATCAAEKAECTEDETCAADRDACQSQTDTLAQCVLDAESSCQGVGEASFYLPDDSGACADELDAFLACVSEDG
jgi:hypothetical protein